MREGGTLSRGGGGLGQTFFRGGDWVKLFPGGGGGGGGGGGWDWVKLFPGGGGDWVKLFPGGGGGGGGGLQLLFPYRSPYKL